MSHAVHWTCTKMYVRKYLIDLCNGILFISGPFIQTLHRVVTAIWIFMLYTLPASQSLDRTELANSTLVICFANCYTTTYEVAFL